jgi:hypothetical protein
MTFTAFRFYPSSNLTGVWLAILLMDGPLLAEEFTALERPAAYADVLDLLAATTEANFENIRQWTGSYSFKHTLLGDADLRSLRPSGDAAPGAAGNDGVEWDGKSYWTTVEGVLDFALDRHADRRMLRFDPASTKYTSLSSGEPIHFNAYTPSERLISTPEHALTLVPDGNFGPLEEYPTTTIRIGPIGYRKESGGQENASVGFPVRLFDPSRFFGDGMQEIWSWSRGFSDAIRSGILDEEQLQRLALRQVMVGDNVHQYVLRVGYNLDVADPALRKYVNYTFDKDAGFNLTRWETDRGGVVYEQHATEFRQVGKIYVPGRFRFIRHSHADGSVSRDSVYTLQACSLNQDIPAETFTWPAIAPEDGTRIVDELEQRMYVYQHGQLIEPEEYQAMASTSEPSTVPWRWWIVGINVLIVLALLWLIVRSRG